MRWSHVRTPLQVFFSLTILFNQTLLAETPEKKIRIEDVPGLIHVPRLRQATEYTCGVTAVQTVLYYYDNRLGYSEKQLEPLLKTTSEQGTNTKDIVDFVRATGFHAKTQQYMTLADLEKHIDRQEPVIILIQAWPGIVREGWENDWENGHFVVAIGYDAQNFYFMDPSTLGQFTFLSRKELLRRWHDIDGGEKVHQLGLIIHKGSPEYDQGVITHID